MKNIRVVAFDCDGVMFDTTHANMAYYNHILDHFARPAMTAEQFAFCHMHTVDESIAHLFEDEKDFRAAQAYRKHMSYVPFLKHMEIEPYLKTLLNRLRPTYKTAVATNRSDTMDRVLSEHNLAGYFDLVVLIKLLEHFKLKSYQSIYVGDSELDQLAAHAAEMPFVAYKNRSLAADYHIQSLKELAQILQL
jgi:phosphoglycolate phosphatase-like HAD superfamily hydrolase